MGSLIPVDLRKQLSGKAQLKNRELVVSLKYSVASLNLQNDVSTMRPTASHQTLGYCFSCRALPSTLLLFRMYLCRLFTFVHRHSHHTHLSACTNISTHVKHTHTFIEYEMISIKFSLCCKRVCIHVLTA